MKSPSLITQRVASMDGIMREFGIQARFDLYDITQSQAVMLLTLVADRLIADRHCPVGHPGKLTDSQLADLYELQGQINAMVSA